MSRSSTGLKPRLSARRMGRSQNFADWTSRSTCTCGGSLGSWPKKSSVSGQKSCTNPTLGGSPWTCTLRFASASRTGETACPTFVSCSSWAARPYGAELMTQNTRRYGPDRNTVGTVSVSHRRGPSDSCREQPWSQLIASGSVRRRYQNVAARSWPAPFIAEGVGG
jgi:hypothetical protein